MVADREALTGSRQGSLTGSGIGSFVAGQRVPGTAVGELTPLGAALTIVTITVGAGVITLPAATGGAGIICGFGLLCFCGIIAVTSGQILCEAIPLAEEQGTRVSTFEDLGFAAGGQLGKNLTLICMQVMNFGVSCIFILLIGQNLGLIVDMAAGSDTEHCEGVFPMLMNLNGTTFGGWILVAAIIMIPSLFMWDMTAVSKLAPFGIAGAGILILAMVIGSFIFIGQHGVDHEHLILVTPPNFSAVIGIFLKSIFSFAGTFSVPALYNELPQKDRSKMKGAVVAAMGGVLIVYVFTCIPTMLAFGQPKATILGNFATFFNYVGAVGIAVHVGCALPIVLNLVFSTYPFTQIEAMKTRNPMSLAIRLVILALAWLIPEVASVLSALVDLVTAVTIIALMIHLPIWFNLALLKRKEGSLGAAIAKIGFVNFAWQVIMACVGVLAIVEGIRSGVSELSDKPPCPLPTNHSAIATDTSLSLLF